MLRNSPSALLVLFLIICIVMVYVPIQLVLWQHPSIPVADSIVIVNVTYEAPEMSLEQIFGGKPTPGGPMKVQSRSGTGFELEGHMLTAAHVVAVPDGGKMLQVTLTSDHGEVAPALVVGQETSTDLAELATPMRVPSLYLSRDTMKIGDAVTLVGHPGRLKYVKTTGSIVGFDRAYGDIVLIDAYFGNSGGPLLNSSGRVMGMMHSFLEGTRFTCVGTRESLKNFIYPDDLR